MNRLLRHPDVLGSLFVFLVTQIVYLLTVNTLVPFWDSGEYIATAHTLGIPHPPGTPLYVLIGRLFSMFPLFPEIATRVNYLSALASSFTAVFTYLITVEIYRAMTRSRDWAVTDGPAQSSEQGSGWIAFFAGSVAAFFTAFGRTFWDNAIEAEVYALSSMIMGLAVWLILLWARPGDRSRRTGLFLLLYYVLCLSMGIHLGTFLVLPAVVLFVLLVDRRILGGNWWIALVVGGLLILLHPGMLPTLDLSRWLPILIVSVLAALLLTGRWGAAGPRGILSWCVIAALLGISTHLFLLIRANLDPAINEADPSTLPALWKVLIRDQYKPENPFLVRQASWLIQLDRHFFDYAKDQYALGLKPVWLGWCIPYLFGLVGWVTHLVREKKSFVLMFSLYLITTVGLIFYLNFREEEVRARDYFFVASFQFLPVWIGLGSAMLLEMLRPPASERSTEGRGSALLIGAGAVLLLLLPVPTLVNHWHSHDRSKFSIAEDYAHNMLGPLEPNAILFTNGDNDTFPLWYLQEVREVRKDIRVVNLSLLNTDWYIRQIRDIEPKVNIGWTDDDIHWVSEFTILNAMYRAGYRSMPKEKFEHYLRGTGLIQYVSEIGAPQVTKDLVVARILEREFSKRPLYLAVTVPDLMGLEDRLVMNGLIFRIEEPQSGETERIDLEVTRKNLLERYRYSGLLTEDWRHDKSVYKDPNAKKLIQNYAAAFIKTADEMIAMGQNEEALEVVRTAQEISPDSEGILYSLGILYLRGRAYGQAEETFSRLIELGHGDFRVHKLYGRSLEAQGLNEEAEVAYRNMYAADQTDFESMRDIFSFLWEVRDKKPEAIGILEGWLARYPDDKRVLSAYEEYRDSLSVIMSSSTTEGE